MSSQDEDTNPVVRDQPKIYKKRRQYLETGKDGHKRSTVYKLKKYIKELKHVSIIV